MVAPYKRVCTGRQTVRRITGMGTRNSRELDTRIYTKNYSKIPVSMEQFIASETCDVVLCTAGRELDSYRHPDTCTIPRH